MAGGKHQGSYIVFQEEEGVREPQARGASHRDVKSLLPGGKKMSSFDLMVHIQRDTVLATETFRFFVLFCSLFAKSIRGKFLP